MSGRGGGRVNNNNGKGNIGISGIPAASRKMVQSLKEIVNCPEPEIYAMLKECNMDPNEAVNRLLSQDPFHEVKSKREKKKENKDSTDLRPRGANNMSNRGGRGGGRGGPGRPAYFSSNESSTLHSKSSYKKENGANAYAGPSPSASGMAGNNINWQPPYHSDSVATENKMSTVGAGDGVSSSSQPSPGYQSAWMGVPGQVSMADIVKMGRPQNKASTMPSHQSVNHHHATAPPLAAPHQDFLSSENYASKVVEINSEPELDVNQHVHSNDEWPSIEQPTAASASSVREVPADSELYGDLSNLPLDRGSQHIKSQFDDVQSSEDAHVESFDANHVGPASVSTRNMQEDSSGGSSIFDNNMYGNINSYQSHIHTFENNEAEDGTSSVAANLQQLSLQNDDQGVQPEKDNPSVIIPNHLQVHTQECSHLSFGSFGSGMNSAFSGHYASMSINNSLEETSEVVDASSTDHSDTRNPEYYGDEHLRNTVDESLVHRAGVSAANYDTPSVPQAETLKETSESSQGNQYAFPSSTPGYSYENTQQLNAAFNNAQTSNQMQNIAPFSSVMQAYTNSLPSALLASTVQSGRETDIPYSPFPMSQSLPTKYSSAASSISGPGISMSEQTPQTHPGANVATGPALPQHLAVHSYSQPTLPLGHFANMISYPFLAQSYTYMPSAFQQTFAGNNTYPQSLAAVLPQYKNSVSVSSLPQSAAVPSGYGYGSSTSIPAGNFPLNAPTAPAGSTIGYDDVLSSQYKDASHLISLQQNENSAMWMHGPGSRTMSAVPASTYYNFQGQNQQPGVFRQGQQPSQHFGAPGYPNYYHSQTGMSLEHQPQNTRDGSLAGTQGQPSKQAQQLWQNIY
ncbi:kinase-related protein [Salix suchowensis]|nr:kinase-related protein [Salix suchowensis]